MYIYNTIWFLALEFNNIKLVNAAVSVFDTKAEGETANLTSISLLTNIISLSKFSSLLKIHRPLLCFFFLLAVGANENARMEH